MFTGISMPWKWVSSKGLDLKIHKSEVEDGSSSREIVLMAPQLESSISSICVF